MPSCFGAAIAQILLLRELLVLFHGNEMSAGLVLAGQLELWLGDKHYHLYEGDSFQFSSHTPHRYCNPGEMTTRVQWMVTPPIYSISGKLLHPVESLNRKPLPDDD